MPAASGMFAPPTAALITAPAPATTTAPVQVPAIAAPAATPGVTSFIKPTDPFAAPPMAGQATSVAPGMLNAAALRGPVSTMPLTTSAATSTLTGTTVRPMANVQVLPPPPQPAPSSHPLLQPGNVETLQPPPQPSPPTNPPAHLLTPPPVPAKRPHTIRGTQRPGHQRHRRANARLRTRRSTTGTTYPPAPQSVPTDPPTASTRRATAAPPTGPVVGQPTGTEVGAGSAEGI